jgi:hypothetical protein
MMLSPAIPEFSRRDVATGLGVTLAYFCTTASAATGIEIGMMVSPASRRWDFVDFASFAVGVSIVALLLSVGFTSSALLVVSPVIWVLSVRLRRVRFWPTHVAAYFACGIVGAASVVEVWAAVTTLSWNTIQFISNSGAAPLAISIILLAGLSGAAGWLHVWRMTENRSASRASELGLAA